MKAIIVGTPGKGKTTLARMLKQDYPNAIVVSLCKLRGALGIHEPHKGYETEVAPQNAQLLYQVLDMMLDSFESIIVEGYGLAPEDGNSLGSKHHCPVVLLCHKGTTIEQDVALMRAHDAKDKWTNFRTDEYLHSLCSFYKRVELEWIERMSTDSIFDTSNDFQMTLQCAYDYIINAQDKD